MLSGSLEDFEKALNIRQKQFLSDPANTDKRLRVAGVHAAIGRISVTAGLLDRASSSFQEALEISKPALGISPPNRFALSTIADSYSGLGNVSVARASKPGLSASERLEQWTEARLSYQKSLSTSRLMRDPSPVNIRQVEEQLAHCDLELTKVRHTQ
jgi:tetratricopeptide (TPR) repeat protein